MASWLECRYCDGGFRPMTREDGMKVCPNCGAEWDPVLIEEPNIKDGE